MSSTETHVRLVIVQPASLFEGEPSGLEKAMLDFQPCEAQVLRYRTGQTIPLHTHSGQTMKVVLSGRLLISDEQGIVGEVGAGDIYLCIDAYEVMAMEDTLMLLLQSPGTVRV